MDTHIAGFIGQTIIVERIIRMIPKDNECPFPHTILAGDSGMGKHRLAQQLARRMSVKFLEGGNKPIAGDLLRARDRDILFLDCGNRVKADLANTLNSDSLMRGNRLFLNRSSSDPGISIYPLTIILSVNHLKCVGKSIRQKFELQFTFEPYNIAEVIAIVRMSLNSTEKQGTLSIDNINDGLLRTVAVFAEGNPRNALDLLELSSKCASAAGKEIIDIDCVKEASEMFSH